MNWEDIREEKIKESIVRSRAQLGEHEIKCSRYFPNLENPKYIKETTENDKRRHRHMKWNGHTQEIKELF